MKFEMLLLWQYVSDDLAVVLPLNFTFEMTFYAKNIQKNANLPYFANTAAAWSANLTILSKKLMMLKTANNKLTKF